MKLLPNVPPPTILAYLASSVGAHTQAVGNRVQADVGCRVADLEYNTRTAEASLQSQLGQAQQTRMRWSILLLATYAVALLTNPLL